MSIDILNGTFTGYDDVEKNLSLLKLGRKDRAKIIDAGAEKMAEHIQKEATSATRGDGFHIPNGDGTYSEGMYMHFTGKHDYKYKLPKRLGDGVTYKKDQYFDGSTDVGFKNGYVTIAHWFNNGTYRQNATFFMNKAFENGKSDVRNAQIREGEKVFKEITRGF